MLKLWCSENVTICKNLFIHLVHWVELWYVQPWGAPFSIFYGHFIAFLWLFLGLKTVGNTYGQIWQFRAKIGHFWGLLGPPGPFSWRQKGPKWSSWMWNTMFNHVQPMFNPFEAAEAAQGQIWPFWVKRGHKMAIKYGLWWPSRLKKCPSTFYYPNWTQRHLIEHSLSEN